MAGAVVRSIP